MGKIAMEQRELFLQIPEPVWVVRQRDLQILDVNLAATERFGYSRERFLAMKFSDFHSEQNIQRLKQASVEKDPRSAELRGWNAKTAAGITIDTDLSVRFLQRDGEDAILICELDMSARKALEERLRQAGKMEAIGMLAGGIAHDFNNLLTVISGYSQLLLSSVTDAERTSVEQVLRASERAADLTGQLLTFSRRQEMQPKRLDVNHIVNGMSTMLRRLIGEHIELRLFLTPLLGAIHADPGQIDQVIMNLVVNAREAMANGGKLVIETSNVVLDQDRADFQLGLRPGTYVMIAVNDTGSGMSPETRARAFDPFFTTKEKGHGTGLGLSTVSGIVRQAGGAVGLYSEPGHGTSVKVFLPMVGEIGAVENHERQQLESRGHGEIILLVEDEEAVRRLVRATLERRGYGVLVASDGPEALQLDRTAERVDLVLTDLVMPQMSGIEVAHRVLEHRPGVRVLFMSGYTDRTIQKTESLPEDAEVLQKPFTSANLAARVRRALDNGSQTKTVSN
jgi:two-component system cell cycle sensor histidine kinase/response regulator CckA